MAEFHANLARLRKQNQMTQEALASQLSISFQAISKWENGLSMPDLLQIVRLADIFHTTVDALLGHTPTFSKATQYERVYDQADYYWGIEPSHMCYDVLRLKPPVRPWRLLDVGCGEGKNAVFFARCGYQVTGFDIAESGLAKGQALADAYGVNVNFFRADISDYRPEGEYDVVFASGVLHYLEPALRAEAFAAYQRHTAVGGVHALNAFVSKPFIPIPPDEESPATLYRSGELAGYYTQWRFHRFEERIFDCHSSNTPHQHCMDVILAEKMG